MKLLKLLNRLIFHTHCLLCRHIENYCINLHLSLIVASVTACLCLSIIPRGTSISIGLSKPSHFLSSITALD